MAAATEYLPAVDGIPSWVAKLRGSCSERTVRIYTFLAEQFLRQDPDPTRLEIQQHLARRLEDGVSPNAVENTLKALASLFRFLYEEGLRPTNPMAGIEPIRTPRKERVVPLVPEIAEVLAKYMKERGGGSPFLFPGKTKTGHCEVSNIEKTLKRACLRAGVRPFTPHQLRNFFRDRGAEGRGEARGNQQGRRSRWRGYHGRHLQAHPG